MHVSVTISHYEGNSTSCAGPSSTSMTGAKKHSPTCPCSMITPLNLDSTSLIEAVQAIELIESRF